MLFCIKVSLEKVDYIYVIHTSPLFGLSAPGDSPSLKLKKLQGASSHSIDYSDAIRDRFESSALQESVQALEGELAQMPESRFAADVLQKMGERLPDPEKLNVIVDGLFHLIGQGDLSDGFPV